MLRSNHSLIVGTSWFPTRDDAIAYYRPYECYTDRDESIDAALSSAVDLKIAGNEIHIGTPPIGEARAMFLRNENSGIDGSHKKAFRWFKEYDDGEQESARWGAGRTP